ncbi:hypothetical protein F5Y06DRAFT_121546 [Hypoxylon sp. FL0890]|nr:hypothetical protein F5Y06DRAFT_121546 [Hypoxylon sp. FL0890]
MDKLPKEIIDIILSFLPGGLFLQLAPFATLSTLCQKAFEPRAFSCIVINSKDEEMEGFAHIVTPINKSGVKRSKMQERHLNEVFTSVINHMHLFQLLAGRKSGNLDEEIYTRDLTLQIGDIADCGEKRRLRRHCVH